MYNNYYLELNARVQNEFVKYIYMHSLKRGAKPEPLAMPLCSTHCPLLYLIVFCIWDTWICPLSRVERCPLNGGSKYIVSLVRSVGTWPCVHYIIEASVIWNVC